MIAHLEGRLVEKSPTDIVIDCNGVGYHAHISLYTFSKLPADEKCRVYTHLSIREDAHVLFAFIDQEERTVFRHLISVSGVGPNTARMVLSSMSPSDLRQAILEGNIGALKAIRGIGGKTAERMIIDLRDKIGKDTGAGENSLLQYNRIQSEALSALQALGFSRPAIQQALKKVAEKEGDAKSVEQMIKTALKYL